MGKWFDLDQYWEQFKYFLYLRSPTEMTKREEWLCFSLFCLLVVAGFLAITTPQRHELRLVAWLQNQLGDNEFNILESRDTDSSTTCVLSLKRGFEFYDLKYWLRSEGWVIEDDSAGGALPDQLTLASQIVDGRTLRITKGRSVGSVTLIAPNLEFKYNRDLDLKTGLNRNAILFFSIWDSHR